MAMLGGECSGCCKPPCLKCHKLHQEPGPTLYDCFEEGKGGAGWEPYGDCRDCNEGACCKSDGSCSLTRQCACEALEGAVFIPKGTPGYSGCDGDACARSCLDCTASAAWFAKFDEYLANAPALQGFTSSRLKHENPQDPVYSFDSTDDTMEINTDVTWSVTTVETFGKRYHSIPFNLPEDHPQYGQAWAAWVGGGYASAGFYRDEPPSVSAGMEFNYSPDFQWSDYYGFYASVGIYCTTPYGSPQGTEDRFMLVAYVGQRLDWLSRGSSVRGVDITIGGTVLPFSPYTSQYGPQRAELNLPSGDWLAGSTDFVVRLESRLEGDYRSYGDWEWHGSLPPGLTNVECENPLP